MRGDPFDHQPEMDPQGPGGLQDIWQAQQKELDPVTLAQIHAKARTFESRIQRRNAVEYAACGIVIVGFSPTLLFGPNWVMQMGAAQIMLGTIYVGWQLHRRGSVDRPLQLDGTLIDTYRLQLIRQHEALRTVAAWYLAPFIPGMAILFVGMWLRAPKPGVPVERAHMTLLISGAGWIVVCLAVWLLNRRGARLLRKRIGDL